MIIEKSREAMDWILFQNWEYFDSYLFNSTFNLS